MHKFIRVHTWFLRFLLWKDYYLHILVKKVRIFSNPDDSFPGHSC